MNDILAYTTREQIRHLLEHALEQLGTAQDGEPAGGILGAERTIAQAAAVATGYRAIASKPGHF